MEDFELLLLSWTQLTAVQMVLGDNHDTESLRLIEDKLEDEHGVTDIQLVGRTYDEYTIAFSNKGENQLIRFDADEVESIYDI
jgi:hypothetical protein